MKKIKYIIFSVLVLFLGFNNIYAYATTTIPEGTSVTTNVTEDTSSIANKCVSCGDDTLPIPALIPNFVSKLILIAQILTPVIIIVVALVKYFKAVASGDEKVIKETNNSFVRSLITGISIFLIITIVKFAFSLVGEEGESSLKCVSCFVNGDCEIQACPDRETSNDNSDSSKSSTSASDYDSGKSSTHTSDKEIEHGGSSRDF